MEGVAVAPTCHIYTFGRGRWTMDHGDTEEDEDLIPSAGSPPRMSLHPLDEGTPVAGRCPYSTRGEG